MEPQSIQPDMSDMGAHGDEEIAYAAPPSLVTDVMARVAQLDTYLTAGSAESELVKATQAPQWEVRAAALQALGRLGERAPLEPLVDALRAEHVMVRVAAVQALGRMGRRAPLEQMIGALSDPEAEVRVAAREAVERREAAAYAQAGHAARLHHGAAWLMAGARRAGDSVAHGWLVLVRQPGVVQRNWLVSVLALFLSDCLVVGTALQTGRGIHETTTLLALVTTLSAVVGVAFAANLAHDMAAELALATATSARTVVLSRFLLVIGSTALLSGCASLGVALLYRQGLWSVLQLWLGPLLLISALTLALVLVVGSWLAFVGASGVELVQTVHFGPGNQLLALQHAPLWQTSPVVIALALVCLGGALLYAPQQSHVHRIIGDR
jgi:hypothetical protein